LCKNLAPRLWRSDSANFQNYAIYTLRRQVLSIEKAQKIAFHLFQWLRIVYIK